MGIWTWAGESEWCLCISVSWYGCVCVGVGVGVYVCVGVSVGVLLPLCPGIAMLRHHAMNSAAVLLYAFTSGQLKWYCVCTHPILTVGLTDKVSALSKLQDRCTLLECVVVNSCLLPVLKYCPLPLSRPLSSCQALLALCPANSTVRLAAQTGCGTLSSQPASSQVSGCTTLA